MTPRGSTASSRKETWHGWAWKASGCLLLQTGFGSPLRRVPCVRGEVSQNPDNPTTVMPEPFSQRLSVLFPDASTFRDLSAMIELSDEEGAELVKEV